jgi:hypothetical protein
MLAVPLLCVINVAYSLTAFEFAFTILIAGRVTLTVVLFHVLIHVVLEPDFFGTICTLVGVLHTLNLQVRAVCFLILVSAFMSLFQG